MNWGNDTKQEMEDLPLFACMTREMRKKYRFGGVLASEDNFEDYNDLSWLESGKCTDHRRKAYYSKEGFSSMEDFLMQFDIIECIDGIRQLDLFEAKDGDDLDD